MRESLAKNPATYRHLRTTHNVKQPSRAYDYLEDRIRKNGAPESEFAETPRIMAYDNPPKQEIHATHHDEGSLVRHLGRKRRRLAWAKRREEDPTEDSTS